MILSRSDPALKGEMVPSILNRGYAYKLDAAPKQAALFHQFAGVCRLVYNLALEQRRDHWRNYRANNGKNISYIGQAAELTQLRAQVDWIAAVAQQCQQQALRDLDKAFANFFAGRADYPCPRRKGVNDSFRFQGRDIQTRRLNGKWSAVKLPKIGWVKFRDTRPLAGKIKNATICHDALGWHIAFSLEIEHEAKSSELPAVGIDRGVANTLSLSSGEHLSLPASLGKIDQQKRRAQRVSARRKRGSKRHGKARARVAKLAARAARIRKDWQHKTALNIASRFGHVTMEALKVRNMTTSARGTVKVPGKNVKAKSGLNRLILAQGWYQFQTILAYKLEERGGTLTLIDPAYTSQACSQCGTIDKESRENQAVFKCRHCGFEAHADGNAAVNILRRGNAPSLRVEGSRVVPNEARTQEAA